MHTKQISQHNLCIQFAAFRDRSPMRGDEEDPPLLVQTGLRPAAPPGYCEGGGDPQRWSYVSPPGHPWERYWGLAPSHLLPCCKDKIKLCAIRYKLFHGSGYPFENILDTIKITKRLQFLVCLIGSRRWDFYFDLTKSSRNFGKSFNLVSTHLPAK